MLQLPNNIAMLRIGNPAAGRYNQPTKKERKKNQLINRISAAENWGGDTEYRSNRKKKNTDMRNFVFCTGSTGTHLKI